ncbi:MAG: 4-alpha-glucanotransferase, partial [Nannocystaceae bacterium]|nr:4-alpha-glucanotransferase [Nannocystaceae bacterium]
MDTASQPSRRSPLHDLAHEYGIEASYLDIAGQRQYADPDAIVAILAALGAPIAGPDDAQDALAARIRQRWARPLPPVCVAWEGAGVLPVRLPTAITGAYTLSLTAEDGQRTETTGTLSASHEDVVESIDLDGTTYVLRQLPLPALPIGYYDVTLSCGGVTLPRDGQCRILAAPRRAYTPEGDKRHWGVFAPLYALHRDDSRGAGDLSDLRTLMRWVEGKGGSAVATLPLLAAYLEEPFEPSPYSPASRLAWNELYVHLESVPEYSETPAVWTALHCSEAHATAAALSGAELVDYHRQYALHRKALAAMAQGCWDKGGARKQALLAFAEARPEIHAYARFRAVVDQRRDAWPVWPTALAGGTIGDTDYKACDYRFHLYAQWCMHEQLSALARDTASGALGLYLDLPVGVGGASFDTWQHREAYVHGLSTGAPPDQLFAGGQNWAFPPLHPERVREDGYRHLIAVIHNHLRYAGVLRIDHVMGLHRLYVIPPGRSAAEGIYLRYRSQELYALLTIESHRAKTLLVGEDLGTVPDEVRQTMTETGVHRLHVLQYEARPDPHAALPPAPAGSVATINTHDMPPFAAFWNGVDIDDRAALGWLDEGAVANEKAARATLRADLRTYLGSHRTLAPDADETETLHAAISYLGRSDATLALVALEDLWAETKPQNIPGTWRECPNWRRRAKLSMEALLADPGVNAALEGLELARTGHRKLEIGAVRHDVSRLSDDDLYLFGEGTHERIYDKLGAHPMSVGDAAGTSFAVWAPSASYVSVIGDF